MSQRDAILDVVRRYWGFDELRPLQEEAIAAGLERRDSLVVLPTGGGKSLCYQVPPAVAGRTDVVVSPLIALMKDQVDGLRASGYPAAALHSGMSLDEVREVEAGLAADRYRLLFVAPERLLTPRFLTWLDARRRARLRHRRGALHQPVGARLPSGVPPARRAQGAPRRASASTPSPPPPPSACAPTSPRSCASRIRWCWSAPSTAPTSPTASCRAPIRRARCCEVLRRHADEAAIVYCLSRKETESLAAQLSAQGIRAAHYHAGMETGPRHRTQEAFAEEKLDVVVATVAFGMGIDRSDVRCVIHAAMPKSIEHYQQETGRAGRDGLEAECVLLYSGRRRHAPRAPARAQRRRGGGAARRRRRARGRRRRGVAPALRHMQRFASGLACRHKTLSEYFGQAYEREGCGACDVCLDEVEGVGDATVTAQKILSVRGARRALRRHPRRRHPGRRRHRAHPRGAATSSSAPTACSRALPRGGVTAWCTSSSTSACSNAPPAIGRCCASTRRRGRCCAASAACSSCSRRAKAAPAPRLDGESWEGVDRDLFEHLRQLRRDLAEARGVPPYIIFSDATLRDLARRRPTSLDAFAGTYGVGERKLHDLGPTFIEHIKEWCAAH